MTNATCTRFGERAVRRGYLTPTQLSECLTIQNVLRGNGIDKMIGVVMQEKGYLTPTQVEEIAYEIGGPAAQPIKGYLIVDKLGKGGMGVVYEAIQESLDRTVALKILPTPLAADKNYVRRFIREAKSAGRLNHPNIVQALDVGESSGYHYFAMEYVEGDTVRERLELMGVFEEQEALEIIYQVALALEHAQQNNIVHRDIKPDNIMLTRDNVVKLCDLGLAKFMQVGGSVTQTGVAIGTPFYLSPEQARGDAVIDTRSDIYSLGASLFHMLTGKVPFSGSSPYIIVSKHLNEEFPDPRAARPELSKEIARLVRWMTEKKVNERCQSPGKLAETIEMMLVGEKNPFDSSVSKTRVWRKGTSRIFATPLLPEEEEKKEEKEAPSKRGKGKIIAAALAVAGLIAVLLVLDAVLANYRYRTALKALPGKIEAHAYDEVLADLEGALPYALPFFLRSSVGEQATRIKEKRAKYEKLQEESERIRLAGLRREQEEEEKVIQARYALTPLIRERLAAAAQFEKDNRFDKAHAVLKALCRDESLAGHPLIREIKLPFPVGTKPEGAVVEVEGIETGRTPLVLRLSPFGGEVSFSISRTAFYPLYFKLDPMTYVEYSDISLLRSPLWVYPPVDVKPFRKITGGPVADGGRIYISGINAAGKTVLLALDAKTGKKLWESGIAVKGKLGPAVRAGDFLFITDGTDKLYAVSRSDGTAARTIEPEPGSNITAGPVWQTASSNYVLVGTDSGKVYQVAVKYLGKSPGCDLVYPVSGAVEFNRRRIVVSGRGGGIRLFDPNGNDFRHDPIRIDANLKNAAPISEKSSLALIPSTSGDLHIVDLDAWEKVWTYSEKKVASEVLAIDENIFFLDGAGDLHSITTRKAHRWTVSLQSEGARGAHVSGWNCGKPEEALVVVAATTPLLIAYSPGNGEEKWRFTPPTRITGPVIFPTDQVYFTTAGGRVYNILR